MQSIINILIKRTINLTLIMTKKNRKKRWKNEINKLIELNNLIEIDEIVIFDEIVKVFSIIANTFVKDFRILTIIKLMTINFREIITINFCLIDTNEFDDYLNNTWEILFTKKFRKKTTTMTSKDFFINTRNSLNNAIKVLFIKEFRLTMIISKDFRKIKAKY